MPAAVPRVFRTGAQLETKASNETAAMNRMARILMPQPTWQAVWRAGRLQSGDSSFFLGRANPLPYSSPTMSRVIRFLVWTAVAALGATAVAVAAFQRGEPVNALWLVIAGVCTFAIGYRFYSAWLMAKVLTIDDTRAPAAVTKADGKDFVPTPKWVVFGHHFAAIAGPGTARRAGAGGAVRLSAGHACGF